MAKEHIKCLIIGAGPAGYTAALYASRANLQPVLYEGMQPGGQLMTTTVVENFPGYPNGVEPFQMMDDIRRQAERFGAVMRSGVVTRVDFAATPKRVWVEDNEELEADTVIIATGASAKYLGLASEKEYAGRGVSACATCDGFFYRKKTVAVVGGGDTACEEALYLAGLCQKVYLIVRKDYLRASDIMRNRVLNTTNIEILFEHNTLRLTGENKVEGADLLYRKGTPDEREVHIAIDGFFLAIGHKPNSELFREWLDLDETGYIITAPDSTRTKVPGVFAAGDVADPHFRQAITAAASGCKAALEAERYLNTL
ncbi:MAG: thioredoxin-disulfide reductase [Paludibacter sp.]|nr:thioredoxin-disulfide reductase [Bacteroidales bacterium]MCM1069765.1 thioredoxin-disulfide reductase [Prevotella sp.]MCM1354450.1 thioredoxin-disulfide reductase [Bacteroides sp.]MCM1443212.1 thioredoxin-disulfide reductase [Muribaculum sp.]MCM1482484.1 thioredoxin-disulfide reductase [Paludibacter sp.]